MALAIVDKQAQVESAYSDLGLTKGSSNAKLNMAGANAGRSAADKSSLASASVSGSKQGRLG